MKTPHTPTPYKADEVTACVYAQRENGTCVRVADCICEEDEFDAGEEDGNAAFIAHAANCHDELLAALQRLFNCVPLAVEGADPEAKIVTSCAYWRSAYDQARSALAKAKGQS